MAYIYVIKNKINNKVYIGATTQNIKSRFMQHTKMSTINKRNYKIQCAVREFGKENFYCELLEIVDDEKMYEKERYYIKKYDSFNNGYNSTLGGKGGKIFTDKETIEEIMSMYNDKKIGSVKIAQEFGVNYKTIVRLLNENGIDTEKWKEKSNKKLNSIKEELIKMYNEGYTYKELADYYNVNPKTIGRYLTKLNAKNKGKGFKNKRCND